MQRRAAAIYVAFFLIVGAASYSLVATATQPTIQFDDPEHQLSEGDEFEVGGQTYTVESIDASMEGGGHGAPATLTRSGEVSWVNDSAQFTAEWENNSTVTYQDGEWRVLVDAGENATAEETNAATLRGVLNETAILEADPQADNETVRHEGGRYVVIRENGTPRLVPADEYFPDPRTQTLEEGQQIDYQGNQSTVSVAPEAVTLTWTGPQANTESLTHQGNVTLSDQQYLAYFPDNETVVLTQQYENYNAQLRQMEEFTKHVNGLWGVSIVSLLTAVVLLGMAYLPSRY